MDTSSGRDILEEGSPTEKAMNIPNSEMRTDAAGRVNISLPVNERIVVSSGMRTSADEAAEFVLKLRQLLQAA